jgi:hypothetical protein
MIAAILTVVTLLAVVLLGVGEAGSRPVPATRRATGYLDDHDLWMSLSNR